MVLKLALNSTFIFIMLGLQVYTTILSHTIFTTTQQLETYFPKHEKTKRTKVKHLNGLFLPHLTNFQSHSQIVLQAQQAVSAQLSCPQVCTFMGDPSTAQPQPWPPINRGAP